MERADRFGERIRAPLTFHTGFHFFRTEGAMQVSPGQASNASVAPGWDFKSNCTLKVCGSSNARGQHLVAVIVKGPHPPDFQHKKTGHVCFPKLRLSSFMRSHKEFSKNKKCRLIEMNNVADHVHILFELHRTEALSNVVMHVKKATSKWLKTQSPDYANFEWQEGYGAFSIGRSQRAKVIAYIRKQQAHHRRVSFQHEFLKFLVSYEVDHDERYLWE